MTDKETAAVPAPKAVALGIKESTEVFVAGTTAFREFAAALGSDNKIDWRDWRHLEPISRDVQAAVAGSDQVIAELKDLDLAEAKLLLGSAYEMVAAGIALMRKISGNNGIQNAQVKLGKAAKAKG